MSHQAGTHLLFASVVGEAGDEEGGDLPSAVLALLLPGEAPAAVGAAAPGVALAALAHPPAGRVPPAAAHVRLVPVADGEGRTLTWGELVRVAALAMLEWRARVLQGRQAKVRVVQFDMLQAAKDSLLVAGLVLGRPQGQASVAAIP